MKIKEFFNSIGPNLKLILADKKRLASEIVFAAWPALFLALFAWLPLFTAQTSPRVFFVITDFSFLMGFFIMITWALAFAAYLLSRVTCLKPYSVFFRIAMILIEGFLMVAAVESCVLYNAILPVAVTISFSFYLLVFHAGVMVVLTALEPLIIKEVEKAMDKPAPKKEEPKPEAPAEEPKPEEPKAEEPAATPVEEPKPEEPKEEKPAPKKKKAEPKAE